MHGTPGGIRTHGLPLRRRPLYPTELRVHAPPSGGCEVDYTGDRGNCQFDFRFSYPMHLFSESVLWVFAYFRVRGAKPIFFCTLRRVLVAR